MAGYWYKKFAIEDKDNGNVDYESLEQAFDIQPPAVSLCLASPFLEKRIKGVSADLSSAKYLMYLKGDLDLKNDSIDEQSRYIEYENVTFDLNDYLKSSAVQKRNESQPKKGSFLAKVSFNGFDELASYDIQKCYEITTTKDTELHESQFFFSAF